MNDWDEPMSCLDGDGSAFNVNLCALTHVVPASKEGDHQPKPFVRALLRLGRFDPHIRRLPSPPASKRRVRTLLVGGGASYRARVDAEARLSLPNSFSLSAS